MKAGIIGGIETIAKAINTHISNASVCYQGCGALWGTTINNCKEADNNEKKTAKREKMKTR